MNQAIKVVLHDINKNTKQHVFDSFKFVKQIVNIFKIRFSWAAHFTNYRLKCMKMNPLNFMTLVRITYLCELLLEICWCFSTFGHLLSGVAEEFYSELLSAHKMKIPKSWHEFVNNKLVVKCVEMCIPCSRQLHSAVHNGLK